MPHGERDRLLGSLLWGAVAACGQYTALFFAIIGRIHVSFANSAPVFTVDPGGPITLTKDIALQVVWALTVAFSLAVFWVAYRPPRMTSRGWTAGGVVTLGLALLTGLAEPWWGLVLLLDTALLVAIMRLRA